MTILISNITAFLKKFRLERLFAVVLVGHLLLTTHVALGQNNSTLSDRLQDKIDRSDADRPKTVGEWQQEARQTEGDPGQRLKRIGKESAEAVREFAQDYPQMAGGNQKGDRNP